MSGPDKTAEWIARIIIGVVTGAVAWLVLTYTGAGVWIDPSLNLIAAGVLGVLAMFFGDPVWNVLARIVGGWM